MKDSYTYEAEYVSQVGAQHYFNVDLGFRIWYIASLYVEPTGIKLKTRNRYLIEVQLLTRRRPHKYTCTIKKKL